MLGKFTVLLYIIITDFLNAVNHIQDIPQLKSHYLGRFIQIRFRDGYYFDCAERWGMLDKDDITSYCKVGSPVLCREPLGKDTSQGR